MYNDGFYAAVKPAVHQLLNIETRLSVHKWQLPYITLLHYEADEGVTLNPYKRPIA
jgi:hypothetical protein